LASIIVDRTYVVCGSRMEAASAAISLIGFGLDLMPHKVLMCMHGGARRGAVVLAHGRPELEVGWEDTCGSEAVARLYESEGGGTERDGRKKKGEWGQPQPGLPYL
jgi:hypothetical protein